MRARELADADITIILISSLRHWGLGERGWEYLERNFFTYSRGHAKYDNWKSSFRS